MLQLYNRLITSSYPNVALLLSQEIRGLYQFRIVRQLKLLTLPPSVKRTIEENEIFDSPLWETNP